LENAAMIFDRHRPDITEKAQQRKIEELETKLKKKAGLILLSLKICIQEKSLAGHSVK